MLYKVLRCVQPVHPYVHAVLFRAVLCSLCGECTTLVENHDKIRALSHAHRNVSQVRMCMQAAHRLPGHTSEGQRDLVENSQPLAARTETCHR